MKIAVSIKLPKWIQKAVRKGKTSHLTFFLLFFPNLFQAKLFCHFSLLRFPLINTNSNHTCITSLSTELLNFSVEITIRNRIFIKWSFPVIPSPTSIIKWGQDCFSKKMQSSLLPVTVPSAILQPLRAVTTPAAAISSETEGPKAGSPLRQRFHPLWRGSQPDIHAITSRRTDLRSVSLQRDAVRFILLSLHIFSGFTFILKEDKEKEKEETRKQKISANSEPVDLYLSVHQHSLTPVTSKYWTALLTWLLLGAMSSEKPQGRPWL